MVSVKEEDVGAEEDNDLSVVVFSWNVLNDQESQVINEGGVKSFLNPNYPLMANRPSFGRIAEVW